MWCDVRGGVSGERGLKKMGLKKMGLGNVV